VSHPGLSESVKRLEIVQESDPLSYYRHPQKSEGRLHGVVIDRFFRYIDFPATVCLVSATVDSYTKSISEVRESYEEHHCSITDYSKSLLKVYNDYDNGVFLVCTKSSKQAAIDFLEQFGKIVSVTDIEAVRPVIYDYDYKDDVDVEFLEPEE
jgi:hypothetical protein